MARPFPGRIRSARRVVILAAVVLVGGAAGVAVAASAKHDSPGSTAGGSGQVSTAPVVRTNLVTTVQVGGSIGYNGSYTVEAPSGASPAEISQQQQAVAQDEQALSADEQAESDTAATDNQSIAAAKTNVSISRSTLSSDQAEEKKACAGSGASSVTCSQDSQKVSQDQASLTQANQQLHAAESAAKTDYDTGRAKVASDKITLAGARSGLASLLPTAVNPGTTYTWLPAVGTVIRQDQKVYSVSDVPVPLLYGPVAAYRAFYVGMSDGADVRELTRDLIQLGYGNGLAQSDHYSGATAAAVRRWQTARGLPATGQILLGDVVFEPGPIRVTSVTPTVGAPVGSGGGGGGSAGSGGAGGGSGGGTVLTATATAPVVTVELDVTQEYLVKPGDAVSVVLPDGTTTVGGRIQAVGNVATCPGGSGTGTGTGGSTGSAGQSPCSSSGSNSGPTVPVTITLNHTPKGEALDQAPVNVNITSQRADNVLAVPVNALLALAGGGYGVDVVTGRGAARLVGVTTGLYSSTLVQVSGPGITVGTRVEVPSS
jgi:hypothetical protein